MVFFKNTHLKSLTDKEKSRRKPRKTASYDIHFLFHMRIHGLYSLSLSLYRSTENLRGRLTFTQVLVKENASIAQERLSFFGHLQGTVDNTNKLICKHFCEKGLHIFHLLLLKRYRILSHELHDLLTPFLIESI